MFRRLLIPLDASPLAERVLAHVLRLFSPHKTELILVHALDVLPYLSVETVGVLDLGRLHANAREYLTQVQVNLQRNRWNTRLVIVEGEPATVICDVADAQGADLVAMTTRGRSGIARLLRGSVAGQVLRRACQPLFLVSPLTDMSATDSVHRLLVPLDGSDCAVQALPVAQGLARESGATILLLAVVEKPKERELDVLFGNASTHESPAYRREAVERYLHRVQQRLQRTGVSSEICVTCGDPGEGIVDVGSREAVDLIVMGTHARAGLERWIHGSIAEAVLRKAQCPLLLLRTVPEDVSVPVPEWEAV